jgi:hypothetical protein
LKLKAIIFALVGLTLCCDRAYSQYIPTLAEGKEWTISLYYGLGSYYYIKYTLCGDTLIQGNNYLRLYRDTDKSIVRFVREDTSLQVVYYWDVDAQSEVSFLAYKGEAGDTIHLTNGDLVFQEVYYDTLFGAVRKVIVIDDLFSLIEGAGWSRVGIAPGIWPPPPWPTLFDLQMSNSSCEDITPTIDLSKSVSIYPNPFKDYIRITTTDAPVEYYEVYNSTGIRVLSGACTSEAELDTKELSPGLYLLVIGSRIIKMIKQ